MEITHPHSEFALKFSCFICTALKFLCYKYVWSAQPVIEWQWSLL